MLSMPLPLLLLLLLRRPNIIVRHRSPLAAVVNALIGVIAGFGVFGDDVPRVKETGEVAEDAEADVYEGVGGAEAAFDPDWEGVVSSCLGLRGREGREVRKGGRGEVPAIGGKRMAMRPRKMSLLHIFAVGR